MNQTDIHFLRSWFLAQRRDLPWRDEPSPYEVWVSEVMLQQTQVAVVIPYFERWMKRFPSIQHLAEADVNDVMKEWEGLGYYSRARNLHSGAQYVLDNYQGELPSSAELLEKIKGLGPYTVGAILNFAFHHRIPAVDGNVLRVIARYHNINEDICKSSTVKNIHAIADVLLPEEEPWIISEALIELGATICNRRPKCFECPLHRGCKAFVAGTADQLPVKSPKKPITFLYRAVAVIKKGDDILVCQAKNGKVMAGLYEFPYFEWTDPALDQEELSNLIRVRFGYKIRWIQALPEARHSFTRYRARLFPHVFEVDDESSSIALSDLDCEWRSRESIKSLPFSSGHRRILDSIYRSRC